MAITNCRQCNKEFKIKKDTRGFFCSRPCYHKSIKGVSHNHRTMNGLTPWNKGKKMPEVSGENHFRWKGGVSKAYKFGYYSMEYRNWRKAIFERDNYACVDCGQAGYITAHHIKSFAHFPELRFEITNGKTLCEDCHKKTDNYKGRAKKKTKVCQ